MDHVGNEVEVVDVIRGSVFFGFPVVELAVEEGEVVWIDVVSGRKKVEDGGSCGGYSVVGVNEVAAPLVQLPHGESVLELEGREVGDEVDDDREGGKVDFT